MISVLAALGIIYFVFWGIFFCRGQYHTYSKLELACFYLMTRLGPAAMLQEGQVQVWRNLLLECAVTALLFCYLRKRKDKKIHSTAYAFYLFQPFTGICILSGRIGGLCLLLILLVFLCICDKGVSRKNGNLLEFMAEYVLAGTGAFIWFWATEILDQHLPDIIQKDEIPVLYIVSLLLMAAAAMGSVWRLIVRPDSGKWWTKVQTEGICRKKEQGTGQRMTAGDISLMVFFTAAFAALVFFRLGSTRAPETYQDLKAGKSGEDAVILMFDEEVTLSRLYIYLGYTAERIMSFASVDKDGTEWTIFDNGRTISNAFSWNEVPIDYPLERLALVLTEGEARIHEIICLDMDGSRILPENAGQYKELFDEQELFTETGTCFDQTMFDEVYHARTAYEFLHRLPIYEDTHPPLGKSLISLGIRAFGMTPFGWRVVCAVFGILMVPVMYCFSHKMFGGTGPACFSTILLSTAFMNYVLARIATLDILAAFFILAMFWSMYGFTRSFCPRGRFREQAAWLFLCGCSMACAVSTKWTGFYAALGIAVVFFICLFDPVNGIRDIRVHRLYLCKLASVCVVCFIIIPVIVYFLSYIPFTRIYKDKGLIRSVIENGKFMLSYHSSIVFEHPYASEWYEWLTDRQPLLDSYTVLKDGRISVVATFGNPLLLWGGLVSLFHQVYLWRCKSCRNARFLCLAYAALMIPWLFIHRTVFIYQYFPAMLILVLMVTNSLCRLRGRKWFMIGISCLSLALFILFFPVLSGCEVDAGFVDAVLEWLPTWKFALLDF